MPPPIKAGAYIPIEGEVRGHDGREEAGICYSRIYLRQVEEGGAGPDRRVGGGLAKDKWRQRQRGGVPLPTTGAP